MEETTVTDLASEDLAFSVEGRIARITLQRPQKLNTVTAAMGRQLFEIAARINADDDILVAVLQSTGERAFSAGSDVKVLDDYGTNFQLRNRPDYCHAIWSIRKPLIAAIRGHCIGGGLEMALSCDIRVASETSSFAAGEIKLGWNGGAGNTQLLPRLVGYGKAMEMVLTGDPIDAATARADGLVQQVVPDAELESAVDDLAGRIAANAPIALQVAKHLVRMSENTGVDTGLKWENDLFAYCFTTQDAQEGIDAFKQKRAPVFQGK